MHNDNNNIDGIIKNVMNERSDFHRNKSKKTKKNGHNTMKVLTNDTVAKHKFAKP